MSKAKSDLEKKVEEGLYGRPEIKKEEKNRFLGQFEERVIRYLTYKQVIEPGTYPEILNAIGHQVAEKLIIDREVELSYARDYIELARENKLDFQRIDSPEFKGDVALVVVSGQRVDVKKRKVLNRKERLQNLGISDNIINNVGAKLCNKCRLTLAKNAPEELINYNKINWWERLVGVRCICQQEES